MKCPEGKYFCNDRQKCMPIPKGTRVRKDGKLVKEASVSKKQQRFFGMVRAAQKGEMKNPSPEVSKVADDISKKDAKKFAKTKHKGLPEKKKVKEEMTYQEAIDAGWEMTGEGIWWPPQHETVVEKITFPKFRKKVEERKPKKAMDAGSKARRKLKRKEHAKYVSGSEDNVPDDIRDHKEYTE
mgnify:CR=1 FL=1